MNDSSSNDDEDMEHPRYILRRRACDTNWHHRYSSLSPIESNYIHGLMGDMQAILCIIFTMMHIKMQVLNTYISNPQQQSVQDLIIAQTDRIIQMAVHSFYSNIRSLTSVLITEYNLNPFPPHTNRTIDSLDDEFARTMLRFSKSEKKIR